MGSRALVRGRTARCARPHRVSRTMEWQDVMDRRQRQTRAPDVCEGSRLRLERASGAVAGRSEEHTSELQSHSDLVCRLLLEKKKDSTALNDAFDQCALVDE